MTSKIKYLPDVQWLKEGGNKSIKVDLNQKSPNNFAHQHDEIEASDDTMRAPSEGMDKNNDASVVGDSFSTPMQNYLKQLYRLDLLTPKEEHKITRMLRKLEDKLVALLQKHKISSLDLRSKGVEQRGSTGAYDHGLIIYQAEKLMREANLSKRDHSAIQNSLTSFQAQRKRLIQCNLRLVIAIAKRFRNPSVPFIDLIQEGNVGLMKAIERFKPQMGYRFSTYAYWWIQQEIQLALRRNDDLVRQPANVQDDMRSIHRMLNQMRARGLSTSDENLAKQTGLELERVQSLLKLPGPTGSLDDPISDDQNSTRLDYALSDEQFNTDQLASDKEMAEHLRTAVSRLPQRQRTILSLRYGLTSDKDCSFRVIGEQLGLSQERARQLHADALRQLKRQWR